MLGGFLQAMGEIGGAIRGMTLSSSAFLAQSRCRICSALRFSAASRNSGATLLGSTSGCALAGIDSRTAAIPITTIVLKSASIKG